jgi:enamine deaminase RidA (YjgF/YER057c/UK114 family)
MGKIEDRLSKLGITLPRPPKAVANYIPGVRVGEILYVAGTIGTVVGPNDEDILPIKGKLGRELTIEQGYQSARINAAPGFQQAPAVLNGASDLLVEVFGPERGKHARAALYQHELTFDAPVETEMTVQVKP